MNLAVVHQPLGSLSVPVKEGSIGICTYEIARRLAPSNKVTVFSRKGPGLETHAIFEGIQWRRIPTPVDDRVLQAAGDHPRLKRVSGFGRPKRPFFASSLAYS